MGTDNEEKDDDEDSDGNGEHYVKRRRAENMSKTQRELLYELVNSNEKLQNDKIYGLSVTRLTKRKEWKKVALSLNSATGPQKTWSQWKKCWRDTQKYCVQGKRDAIDVGLGANIAEVDPNRENTPNSNQLNCLINEIVAQRRVDNPNIWMSLSTKLNTLGPCTRNAREWKNVWLHHKSNVRKLVDRNGTNNLNHLQRLAYEHMQLERRKNVCTDPVNSVLAKNRLQLLQSTADEECNIVGSLVAVKLRSMQKEQKLIAEKLISEILFQGQMEMFQYSDSVVNIPGYMQLIGK